MFQTNVLERPASHTPLVSVVLPTYNREGWLPRSVGSVLSQTMRDWELIVIDDGSTDNTLALLEQYTKSDSRIHWHPNTHTKGPSGARNQGLEWARGKYVAYLDSDDEWMTFHLERMVYYLEKYPSQIDVMTANPVRRFIHDSSVSRTDQIHLEHYQYTRLDDAYVFDKNLAFGFALEQRITTTQTIVMKRDLALRLTWDEDLKGSEDCLYPLDLAANQLKIAHLQEFHVTYWMHDSNLTNCAGQHSADQMLEVHHAFVLFLQKVLNRFCLTRRQMIKINRQLADIHFWQLGYNCYLTLGNYTEARASFLRAMRIRPLHPPYLKAFVASFWKQILGHQGVGVGAKVL